jgi:hypothetical protein
MDSEDSTPSTDNDELMLNLHRNGNRAILADSPSFRRPQSLEHVYSCIDRDTPVTANNARYRGSCTSSHLPAPYAARDKSEDEEDDDDEDPLRTAALSQSAASRLDSYRSATNISSPFMAAGGGLAHSGTVKADRLEVESQPSDEMEDSMAQDLEGFADELNRIKRNIGLSSTLAPPSSTPSGRWDITTAPMDEISSTMVTPDDESRILSARRR